MLVITALIVLLVTMIIGLPIPLAFLASAGSICLFGNYNPSLLMVFGYNKINSILLLTIPLFVLAGSIMDKGGIGEKLIGTVAKGVGKIRGGLGIVTVVSCAVFGAVSGSSSATLSCIGSIMTPRLKENGYPDGLIGALIASSGVLGILIPPSMLMILYAWATGESVLACFLATILPGLMLIVLFSAVNCFYAIKNPNIRVYDSVLQQADLREKKRGKQEKEFSAIPALLMPVIILGSIYGGILTATEAAAFSVIYALPVGMFYYKKIDRKAFNEGLIQAGETAGVIMTMLFSVMILSRLYVSENLPKMILTFLTSISENRTIILVMINIFMIILGMLMDDCSATILAAPILLPVMTALGVSPIHFAAILGVNIGMGNVTPPTAPLLYLGGRISGAEVRDMLGPNLALIIFAWLPTLVVTTYIPAFGLFLPRLFGYA
ncbi:MAG: TRAP transporter large permease [Synergistaceae bacterium]|jgi:tripartite ATP-independent transporter DctM subunit|nr:TRAP transporter large permease [Synergistaceae bacterium]